MHIVYLATNRENGKRYVGATKHSLDIRKKRHFYDARRGGLCRVFYAAIRKYGEGAFDWSVLTECASLDEAMAEEIRQIDLLRPEYNITSGGKGLRGIPRTREWIEKAAAANRGQKRSPETVQRIKDSRPPELHFKSVVCLDDGVLFNGVKTAAAYYCISGERIGAACRGQEITAGGLHFVFATESIPVDERRLLIAEMAVRRQKANDNLRASRRKAVVCLNDGKMFESGAVAARAHGLSVMRVSQMCRNGSATKDGIRFAFVGEERMPAKSMSPERRATMLAGQAVGLVKSWEKTSKRVVCLDDGVVYESISAASRARGFRISDISAAIHRNGKTKGMRFAFVDAMEEAA